MQMRIVPKESVSVNRKRFPVNQYYGPVSEMPNMNVGPAVNITVIPPEDITNYEPEITIDIPVIEMDMVSAYPPELTSKYMPLEYTGNFKSVKCKECKIPWSPDGINENGYCIYCLSGWNGHSVK